MLFHLGNVLFYITHPMFFVVLFLQFLCVLTNLSFCLYLFPDTYNYLAFYTCLNYSYIKIFIFQKLFFDLCRIIPRVFLRFDLSLFTISQSDTFFSSVLEFLLSIKYNVLVNVLYSIVSSEKLRTLRLVLFCKSVSIRFKTL